MTATAQDETFHVKWTNPRRKGLYYGRLPAPGKSATCEKGAELCSHGWHACRADRLADYLGPCVYLVALSGGLVVGEDKVCAPTIRAVRRLRWGAKDAAAFLAWLGARNPDTFATAHASTHAYARASAPATAHATARAYAYARAPTHTYAHERRVQSAWILARLRANDNPHGGLPEIADPAVSHTEPSSG